jgi:AraC family transcriptional regulator
LLILKTRSAETQSSSGPEHPTVIGSAVYDRALEHFGGRRIEARSSVDSNELLVALYESPPYHLKVAPMVMARLSINLASVPVSGAIASSHNRAYQGRRYSLFYTPAGSDAYWSKARQSRHFNIYFREALIEELADGCVPASLSGDRPMLDTHVRLINPLIDALELSLGRHDPFADDTSLGLAHLIVASLVRIRGRRAPTLNSAALAQVRDYVAGHLGETIRVADLAAVANLSVARFALYFQASTGVSPHRFVLNRRVEAAMGLLRDSPLPMAEVAVACGFSSQQHMATVMRRLAGVAPSSIRGRQHCREGAKEKIRAPEGARKRSI